MIDTIAAITGKNANHSAEALRELCRRHPEVHVGTANYKFVGKGQKSTLVTHVWGIIEVGGGTKLRDVTSQHEWDVAYIFYAKAHRP